jgi:hypothetical protein
MALTDRLEQADRMLGDGHPLAAAERSMAALREQAVVCLGIALASPAVAATIDRASALALLVSALLVEIGLWIGMGIVRSVRRQRIHDMIVAGSIPALAVVAAEVRRLADHGHRDRLATSLEKALHDGEHWHEFMPAARPPYGVRNLPAHAATIREIASRLREERASIRGVVLVERLLQGGFGSALYDADRLWLTVELNRIRFELSTPGLPAGRLRDAA